ncbi:MAG: dihydrodipicolinate synthase family protein [Bifidobacteriaceae bacterium]|jgi:4-hydroxy-tetrahydrodipicolinate synthase|nr:dihydrodipicolinate synthase family protein [Bifidobacteriaceae bacterium]
MPRLICATTVPFDAAGDLDAAGLTRLFQGLAESGIGDVFTPGTTGEFTTLDDGERLAVIEAALATFGPPHVYAHVGAASTRQAVALARRARDLGATRFAAITPYFVAAGPTATADYFRSLAEAVPEGEFFVYVFRDRASTDVTPTEMAHLATISGIAGAKVSGLDTPSALEYVKAVPAGWPVYSGNDREMLRFVRGGGQGAVAGISGVFPEPFIAAAAALDDPSTTDRALAAVQTRIDRAVDLTLTGDFAMLKAGVALRGLPSGPLRIAVEAPDRVAVDRLAEAIAATA